MRRGSCFCFENGECILIMSVKEQFCTPFFPILVLILLQIPLPETGQEEFENFSFSRNKKRWRNYNLKELVQLSTCVPLFINSMFTVWIQPPSLHTESVFLLMSIMHNNIMNPELRMRTLRHHSKEVIHPLIYTSYNIQKQKQNKTKIF